MEVIASSSIILKEEEEQIQSGGRDLPTVLPVGGDRAKA